MENQAKTNTEQKEQQLKKLSKMSLIRSLLPVVGLVVIFALIVLVIVTGVTGSKYFMPSLALMIIVPILIYVALWLGKVLQNHRKNRS